MWQKYVQWLVVFIILFSVFPMLDNAGSSRVEKPRDVTSGTYFAKDGDYIEHTPSIVQVSNDSYYIAYESGDSGGHWTINMTWSSDGVTWSESWVAIDSSGSMGNRHPTLIEKQNGDLMVAYFSDRNGDYELFTATSSDGHSWTENGPLAVDGPAINPFLIQEDNGEFSISYQRYGTAGSRNDGAYFTHSTDGVIWGSGTEVCGNSEYHALPRLMRENGGGDYMFTYQGGTTGTDFEIRYKTSPDGASWSSETVLTNTGNSHDSFPMELENGTFMVWFATAAGDQYEIHRKWSNDMTNWSPDEFIDVGNPYHDTQPHPVQLSSNESFLLSWGYARDNSYSDVDISLIWIEDIQLSTFDIALSSGGGADGWNFVSYNLLPSSTDIVSILDDPTNGISGSYDKVMFYDAGTSSWKTYVDGRATHYNDLDTWNEKMGIWIHMNESDTLTIEGTVPTSTEITLQPGWNMVGYPSETAGNNGLPTEVTKVGYFNSSSEYNLNYHHDPGTFDFNPGEAYWIYNGADTSVIWTVDY